MLSHQRFQSDYQYQSSPVLLSFFLSYHKTHFYTSFPTGITSGKTFCGLVGSTKRHEYAVMGPSTNLSARLMCKAPPNGVICDMMTRNRDRTHEFEKLADVVAKVSVCCVVVLHGTMWCKD